MAGNPAASGLIYIQIFVFRGNPLKYTDPDGNDNVPILSTYLMNAVNDAGEYVYADIISGDPSGTLIYESGCAITDVANLASTLGKNVDPASINTTDGYVVDGEVAWDVVADGLGLSLNSDVGQFSHGMYDAQGNDRATNYYSLIKVRYNSANSPHWVGVQGIETIGGIDYVTISPTSVNDNPADILGPSRTGQGWIRRNGNVYIPVEETTEYRIFSAPKNNE
jgi:hypothetical protein